MGDIGLGAFEEPLLELTYSVFPFKVALSTINRHVPGCKPDASLLESVTSSSHKAQMHASSAELRRSLELIESKRGSCHVHQRQRQTLQQVFPHTFIDATAFCPALPFAANLYFM